MVPMNREKMHAENLRTLGDRGRAASEAALRKWCDEHPTIPCARCFGKGFYAERAGERRPFDHRNFDAAAGDAYVASCPECRGFGYKFTTQAEASAHHEALASAARADYRATRARVCRERGMSEREFDAMARRRLSPSTTDEHAPSEWLLAARAVAAGFGVDQ